MKKKFLALVLTLSMVLSLVPMTALATGDGSTAQTTTTAENQAAGEGANGGSQENGSTAGSGDSTGASDTNTNTDNTDENGSGNTGGTEPGAPSTPDTEGGGTSSGGTTEGGGTGTGGGTEGGGTEGGGEIPSTPEASTDAAKIGETKYETIAKAIEAAESSNNTITLLRDVEENITIGKSLTLDLAGFKLTGTDEGNAVVTITGSDETKPTVTIKSSKVDGEKPVNGTITGGKNSGIRITDADVMLNDVAVTKNTTDDNGGGIYIKNGTLNISGGEVTYNSAAGKIETFQTSTGGGSVKGYYGGGGIFARNSAISLNGVSVSHNEQSPSSSCHGGGILLYYGKLEIANCMIDHNSAVSCGGGVCIVHADVNISDSHIDSNKSQNGAGIYFYDGSDHKEANCPGAHEHSITGTQIGNNQASSTGGGMYTGTTGKIFISDCSITKNRASSGGGISSFSTADVTFDKVSIAENEAPVAGGFYINATLACNTDVKLQNGTEIKKNNATQIGGGIYANAMFTTQLSIAIANSSISNNTAATGAGIATNNQHNKATINIKLESGAVVQNNAATKYGGGIYVPNKANVQVAGTVTTDDGVSEGSALYNNTAGTAGDDLFLNDATFTLPNASEMSGDKQFKISDEENGTVTGWFYDGWFKWDPNAPSASGEAETKGAYVEAARWSMDKADAYTPVENDTLSIALKAATKKAPSPGGSGGGHRPSNPPVTIPDDVPTGLNGKDHYAYVVGYPDGMVYPQKNITRAEVATIFFRLLKDETREANMTKSNSYNDMKDGAWYTCAVSTLSKMGIIKGYEDGSFKPDASISRAEFAAIAARFDPDGDKTPATFSDVSSHWAKDEISIAANHGWIKGYEDGSFKPDQKITRAETMTLVNRVLKRLPETKDDLHKDMKTWPDNQNESAWFYLAVQEATNSHYQNLKKDGTHEKWESMRETRDWAALEK